MDEVAAEEGEAAVAAAYFRGATVPDTTSPNARFWVTTRWAGEELDEWKLAARSRKGNHNAMALAQKRMLAKC